MPVVAQGALVEIAYVLRDDAGMVLERSDERSYTYVHGGRQILPALEARLAGMTVGEERHVTLTPDEAFGAVDAGARTEVPKHRLPAEALAPGVELTARGPDGREMFVRVEAVLDDTVVLNLNHPFAGKTLHFDVRVLQIVAEPC